ncbi:sensor histidine kinase [Acidicapsa acidisoli]|uniref:sensor histidine kinase n=1 Tax=Acidicapsa acidisoli TaxID=1615681 RepID=UPI0021DF7E17|nr:sensor histidine kinase [Acidicapsa acidisoli]
MRRAYQVALGFAVLSGLAPCRQIHATQTTAQYSVTAWGHKDGLPSTFIYAVAQTPDGFLWLGTADGLVRFDGVQFTQWRSVRPNGQPLGRVTTLNLLRTGDLLLGTGSGLLGKMRNGDLQTSPLRSYVESIQEAQDGSLWVATSKALWHLDATTLQSLRPPLDLPMGWLSGPQQDRDGSEWITTGKGVFHVDLQGRMIQFPAQSPAPSPTLRSWLLHTPDGRLELLDEHGSLQSPGSGKTIWQSKAPLPKPSTISGATVDSDGNVWIALLGSGVLRLTPADGHASEERFTRGEGLSSDFVRFLFEDREHNLWAATENGLDRLRRNGILSLTRREGLLSDTVTSIAAGRDNSVWLGTSEGLEQIVGEQHAVYLRGTRILSLLMGRDQRLWIGTRGGLMQWTDGRIASLRQDANFLAVTELAEDSTGTLWLYDTDKGLFYQKPSQPAAPVTDSSLVRQTITAMYSSRDGVIWFGLENGGIVNYRDGKFHAYSPQDGLSGGEVRGLSEGAAGELWAATERGLCFSNGEHFECRNTKSGLPGDRLLWAIPDVGGNIWLGYNFGVARLDARELRNNASSSTEGIQGKLFDDGDGIENSPDREGNAPAVLAPDGRLWLTTSQGIAVVDPAHLRTNPIPPPIQILGLEADGQQVDLSRAIRLQPLTHSIQISFTGLCMSDPRKVRFRYRLVGFDREWHDGGSRREASYTNLPPRRYMFRVLAANSDGVWNDTGATLDFILAPAYFQTLWFGLLCAAVVLACVLIIFRVRLRTAQRMMKLRYEERVEERTRIAQELHDHLLQEMVGIGMQLEVAHDLIQEDTGAKKPLQRALFLSRSAIASGRLTLQSLRDRTITGPTLLEALRRTAEAYPDKDRIPVRYLMEGNERPLCPEIAEDLSEIGQEALRNALKHAGEAAITVRLHFGRASLDLSVHDEGPGVDETVLRAGAPGHYGLVGMRERAARIRAEFMIQSAPRSGTTVLISVPGIRAYQKDSAGEADNRSGWRLWEPFRLRPREEKEK